MNKQIEQKLSKARSILVLERPFFANLVLRLDMIEDENLAYKSMCTNGREIRYHPEFIEKSSIDHLIAVLAHEALHVIADHMTRRNGRDGWIWNVAGDYCINGILKEDNFHLPEGVLYHSKFDNKSAEKIYDELYDKAEKVSIQWGIGKDGEIIGPYDPTQMGGVEDASDGEGNPLSDSEKERLRQEWQIAVQQAYNVAKSCGNMPGSLKRMIEEFLTPKVNWKEALSQFVVEKMRNEYDWSFPNKRYTQFGIYLPRLSNYDMGKLAFMIDVSGSISKEEFRQMVSELADILSLFPTLRLETLFIDTIVQTHMEFDGNSIDDLYKIPVTGGGGTSYKPGFEYIEKEGDGVVGVVYITDGECNDFPTNAPDYPVLWVLTQKITNRWKPPFGTSIFMDTIVER